MSFGFDKKVQHSSMGKMEHSREREDGEGERKICICLNIFSNYDYNFKDNENFIIYNIYLN